MLPDGKREQIHSHNWFVETQVSSENLNKMGLVFDFNKLKQLLDEAVNTIANSNLEDNPCFQQQNSSAENVAKYIYESIEKKLPSGVRLDSITVTEEPDCWASYKKP